MSLLTPFLHQSTAALIAAENPDIPGFLFSPRCLTASARTFLDGFPGLVTYAVKSNPSPHIVSGLLTEGVEVFDVASLAEMALVRSLSPDAVLHYNNPVRTRREIEAAWSAYGVKSFSIDQFNQLDQIAAIIPPSEDVEITVRFKVAKSGMSFDFGTKFGIDEVGATELMRAVAKFGYTPSLCFHVGSQCEEAEAFTRHIQAAGRIAGGAGMTLKRLNVGGGFPASYPSSVAPDLTSYFAAIAEATAETFGDNMPELICEPGRALSTPSTSLLLRVKHRRGNALYLNDGTYGALMEVKFMSFTPAVRAFRGDAPLFGELLPFTVFGPTCDSYDVLLQSFYLPECIEEDDWVEFGQMGAYTQASTTSFNGFGERAQYYVDEVLA